MEKVLSVRGTKIALVSQADARNVKIGDRLHKGESVWKVSAAEMPHWKDNAIPQDALMGLVLKKIQGWDEALVDGVMLTLL